MTSATVDEPAPAATGSSAGSTWLDQETLKLVRPEVRRLLEQSPGFRALPPDQQRELARNMVRIAAYMSNPDGLAKLELTPGQGVLARAQADAVDAAKNKASEKIGTFAGADFKAGAMREGGEQFTKFVGAVDFPKFVGGLIQNVFQAIVDASIQQMRAYADMLKSVSQSVEQFAQDNITMDGARAWLVDKFPADLKLEDGGPEDGAHPRMAVQSEDEDAFMARVNQEIGLAQPITDLSDEEQEARLTQAARMQMARSRQQLLASMVILGINRIVVTDGSIKAKVVFDFHSNDQAKRDAGASLSDTQMSRNVNRTSAHAGSWGWGAATSNVNEQAHRTTVSSAVDETSESKADMKAKLTGDVQVNFKSDYFPMEKLATPGMMAAIQGNSMAVDPNVTPGPARAGASSPGPAAAPAARP